MKVWLIGLGLSLLCSVFAVDGFDGDIQQVAGTWHVSAVATECKCMLKHKDRMKMMVVTLTPQEADSVTMDTTIPMPNGCKKISMKFTKNENGEYKHSCEWGNKIIKEGVTSYEGALIVKAVHEKKGNVCRLWTLMSRSRTVNQDTLNDFVSDAEAAGFTPEQINIMPPEVACVESQ